MCLCVCLARIVQWVELVRKSGQGGLFVNWHPAPMGHEVIGHQFAFYYLQVMEQALDQLVKAATASAAKAKGGAATTVGDDDKEDEGVVEIKRLAGTQPMPDNVHCADPVCKFLEGDRPKCAYSFLPKAMGPDVGDWMVNGTAESARRRLGEKKDKSGKGGWTNQEVGESY